MSKLQIGSSVKTYFVQNLDEVYIYNGSAWVKLPTLFSHNDLINQQGGIAGQRYHLTQAQHDTLTDGSDASSYHNHDSQYYRHQEVGRMHSGSGNSDGTVSASKAGDFYLDTDNNNMFFSTGSGVTSWYLM